MSTAVRCPSCFEPIPAPVEACRSCSLPLVGVLPARLWEIDQTLAALSAERNTILHTLRAHAADSGTGGPTTPAPPPFAVPAHRAGYSGQKLLLGAGVLLLLVAAAVFLAVTWSLLGVAGQVAVMGVLTVAAAAVALRFSRRGLRASAEATAVLATGLAAVDLLAAYGLDLAGLRSLDTATYLTGAAAALSAALVAVGSRDLRIRTFPVAAVLSAGTAAAASLWAVDTGYALACVATLVLSLAFAAVARSLPPAWAPARVTCWVVAGVYLAGTVAIAVPEVYLGHLTGAGGVCAVVALVAAVATGAMAGLGSGLPTTPMAPLALVPVVVVPATLFGLARHVGPGWLAALTVVASAVAAAAAWARAHPLVGRAGVVVFAGHLVAASAAVATRLSENDTWSVWTTVAFGAVAASATVAALARPALRPAAAPYALLAAAFAADFAVRAASDGVLAGVLTVVALVGVAVAAWRRGRPTELTLLGAAAVTLLWALGSAMSSPRVLAAVLAAIGLAALAYAILPGRGVAALLGVAGCTGATWTLLHDSGVEELEAYTLPLAALAAVVGAVHLRRHPDAPSWTTVGPALSAALLPSAFAAVGDDGLTRPLLVLAAGAAVMLAGVALRWQSPLLTGSAAVAVAALSQLAPYAVGLPRWISLGAAGLLLLVVGMRYEERMTNARHAARWVRSLR